MTQTCWCFSATMPVCDLFLCSEMRKNTKKPQMWNIKATKQLLGPDICKHILFLHAVLGCDTTSRLHGVGKGASLKKFKESAIFRQQAEFFFANSSSQDDVARAGEKALVIIYNGKPADTLDSLRYHRFCEKVASSSTHIEPQALPPTSGAAKYHSLRVYRNGRQQPLVHFNLYWCSDHVYSCILLCQWTQSCVSFLLAQYQIGLIMMNDKVHLFLQTNIRQTGVGSSLARDLCQSRPPYPLHLTSSWGS